MKRLLITFALLSALAACKGQNHEPARPAELGVSDAVIRLAPVEGRPAAGYFTVYGGKTADRLTAISSPSIATIELHENKMTNGMMSMQPLTGMDVPAGGKIAFEPRGNHAMIYGIDPSVKAGGTVTLRFTFQSGATVDAEAKALAMGDDMAMEHEGH